MIYLALGANLPSHAGPPETTLRRALDLMQRRGIEVVAVSPFYESPAWPNPADPPYVNAVADIATKLGPTELMRELLQLETEFGRKRAQKNAPRTLDLDILDFGGLVVDAGHISLPHPRLDDRAFVLRPLADIAPAWRHPVTGQTVQELLKIVGDEGLRRLDNPPATITTP